MTPVTRGACRYAAVGIKVVEHFRTRKDLLSEGNSQDQGHFPIPYREAGLMGHVRKKTALPEAAAGSQGLCRQSWLSDRAGCGTHRKFF